MQGVRFNCFFGVLLKTAFLVLWSQHAISLTWNDGPGGATRDYYSAAAKLPWGKKLGDWRDANGDAWGKAPFTEVQLTPKSSKSLTFNVKPLVSVWQKGKYKNTGFYLRGISGGVVELYSKEYANVNEQPQLYIETNIRNYLLMPISDTFLDASTYKSLGNYQQLKVSTGQPTLISFDIDQIKKNDVIKKAELRFTVKKVWGRKVTIGVFRLDPAPIASKKTAVIKGIAEKYPMDKEISTDADVYFSTGFEDFWWESDWVDGGRMGKAISSDDDNKFKTLYGKALSATLLKGHTTALNQRLKFKSLGVKEPELAYFRYYLRLADDWDQTVTGGKLPGFAGTYNRAGWGSRKPDGSNGWSTRGGFLKTIHSDNKRVNPIGSYVYHLDQDGNYGSIWTWSNSGGALLENNRWYCIEQFVKLNDPDKNNGELKAWLDGRLVFEKKGLRFRLTKDLKIEEVWFDIYHGGSAPSPKDQTVYMDNLVVSKKYIGPLKRP